MPLYRLVSVSSLETASGGNQTVTLRHPSALRLASCRRVAVSRAAREAGVVELVDIDPIACFSHVDRVRCAIRNLADIIFFSNADTDRLPNEYASLLRDSLCAIQGLGLS